MSHDASECFNDAARWQNDAARWLNDAAECVNDAAKFFFEGSQDTWMHGFLQVWSLRPLTFLGVNGSLGLQESPGKVLGH